MVSDSESRSDSDESEDAPTYLSEKITPQMDAVQPQVQCCVQYLHQCLSTDEGTLTFSGWPHSDRNVLHSLHF